MKNLTIYEKPNLEAPSLVLGFSGWMNGGSVSTETVKYLRDKLKAKKIDYPPRRQTDVTFKKAERKSKGKSVEQGEMF